MRVNNLHKFQHLPFGLSIHKSIRFSFFFLILGLSLLISSCTKEKDGPLIDSTESNFCINAGDVIQFTVTIEDESNLQEVKITAPNLNYSESLDEEELESANGNFQATYGLDVQTDPGIYQIIIIAIDVHDNKSEFEIVIEVKA